MSRKNFDYIKQVIQINALRKNLDNWQIIDLNQLSHYDIAKTLNESIYEKMSINDGSACT